MNYPDLWLISMCAFLARACTREAAMIIFVGLCAYGLMLSVLIAISRLN